MFFLKGQRNEVHFLADFIFLKGQRTEVHSLADFHTFP